MGRRERRKSERNGAKLMQGAPQKFTNIELNEQPFLGCSAIYKNHKFFVFIWDEVPTTKGVARKIMVRQHDQKPIANHWREMQNIKNEFFGAEAVAVEYYPAESKLVDSANLYWLWVFPDDVLPIPML